MSGSDFLVTEGGRCHPCELGVPPAEAERPHRLYRFLTEVEDLLAALSDDRQRLQAIRPLVRQLLVSCWSVLTLYDDPDFPLTLQTVAWSPGQESPVHNHGTWGVVAIISGQEKNGFWRIAERSASATRVERVEEQTFWPGDIVSFTADAIHHIEAVAEEPTVTFNLYGPTDPACRFEFDPVRGTAERF
ncbi:MAG: cupin [Cyanobacteria bacterium QS_8_64_29]|nr:MAG: cupin [Cyanobacteria bacterium QS_8_64_29]